MASPGHVVVYPNRDKAQAKLTKMVVMVLLLISVVLVLVVTVGAWTKLQGMKPLNFIICIVYLIIAFYVMRRWSRGALPMAAGFGLCLLMVAIVAGTGIAGTSWFDREHFGFAPPQTPFYTKGLGNGVIGAITLLIAPIQVLLILFSLFGFSQGWNTEVELPEEEAKEKGYTIHGS